MGHTWSRNLKKASCYVGDLGDLNPLTLQQPNHLTTAACGTRNPNNREQVPTWG